jgi:hypothetical protein
VRRLTAAIRYWRTRWLRSNISITTRRSGRRCLISLTRGMLA